MDKKLKPGSGLQILLLLLIVFFSQSAWADKTDIVYHRAHRGLGSGRNAVHESFQLFNSV